MIKTGTMRYLLLGGVVILPGVAGVAIFGYYAMIDWDALQIAYQRFETIQESTTDLSALFVAEAQQNIHRINLFAEGVWALLSAILAAIGIHGMTRR